MALATKAGVGELLRTWRQRRRLSQLDLASQAEVSARHLSFVETGRSKPSRELVLHLAEHLDVPLRERNALLLAAGYAPVHPQTPLEDEAMAPVRSALDRILASHAPFPALIVDRRWDIVTANEPALALLGDGVNPELLRPPVNAMRASLHPEGLAPRIRNFAEWSAHLLERLHRQLALTADPAAMLFVPLRLAGPDGRALAFFSTIATFGTAVNITLAELSIESFFPADEATERALLQAKKSGEILS